MSIESRSRQYGKVFDHWQIREFLGSGSGGKTAVFRLTRIDSSRGVSALKVVNLIEERGSFDEMSDFHRKEYQAAREECSRSAAQEVWLMDELRGNTNIVDYLDHTFVDWSEEDCFGRDLLIRMELLKDLRSELRNGRMFTEAEVLKIGRDICAALELCHNKNILHRDVKPENIFRNKDGNYKLGDFGVSRVLDACPGAVASTGIGTYEYWPAEQMTGSYDKRVDIYSLGLVLYEMSNRNRLPFAASTYVTGKEVSLRLSGAPMTEPTEVSQALARVILKACAFRPEDRYSSAEELWKALEDVSWHDEAFTPNYSTVAAEENPDAYKTAPVLSGNNGQTQTVQRSRISYTTEPAQTAIAPPAEGSKKGHRLGLVLLSAGLCLALIFAYLIFLQGEPEPLQLENAKSFSEESSTDTSVKGSEDTDPTVLEDPPTTPSTTELETTSLSTPLVPRETTVPETVPAPKATTTPETVAAPKATTAPETVPDPTETSVLITEPETELSADPVLLTDLPCVSKNGKLWTRSETPPSGKYHTPRDAPGCWSNTSIPGHTNGPVRDNRGNVYTFGMHVDGSNALAYSISFRLDGAYSNFSGICGYPENVISTQWAPQYTKSFTIYGDGRWLYTSADMNVRTSPAAFEFSVEGVQVLTITYSGGEGPNEVATLFDPYLS